MTPEYLTTSEAAQYLRFPTVNAFRKWLGRNRIPVWRSGRVVRFRRDVLDGWGERKPRHIQTVQGDQQGSFVSRHVPNVKRLARVG